MTQILAWFDRRFDHAPSPELLPNLAARLRGTPARLEDLLRNQPHDLLTTKSEGKWSPQEHAGHLLDLEPLWLARVEDYVLGSTQLTLTDITNRKTDEANHNNHPLDPLLTSFRTNRHRLLTRLESLPPSAFTQSILHPRLKTPMLLMDHLHFVAEHDDHHLARIWELLEAKP